MYGNGNVVKYFGGLSLLFVLLPLSSASGGASQLCRPFAYQSSCAAFSIASRISRRVVDMIVDVNFLFILFFSVCVCVFGRCDIYKYINKKIISNNVAELKKCEVRVGKT